MWWQHSHGGEPIFVGPWWTTKSAYPEHLFGHGKCLEVPGYTTYAMASLCKPRLLQVKLAGGIIQTRSIGHADRVDPATLHRCLARLVWQELVDWTSLAQGTPEHCSAND